MFKFNEMKTLLIATDFSANSRHAAEYGYMLAAQLKSNLVLCNALIVPAEVPDAGLVSWPMYEYEEILKDSQEELKDLRISLEQLSDNSNFKPLIHCVNNAGTVTAVISDVDEQKNIFMNIMATHGGNGLSTLLVGNHSRRMIDETTIPLLLVPFSAPIKPIKKVVFATDFKDHEKDLKTIYKLIDLIKPLNAELLITHIHNEKDQSPGFKKWLDNFLA